MPNPWRTFPWWHELTLVVVLVGLLIGAGSVMPSFLAWHSQLLLSRQLWEMAILALAMTTIMITGGIDLSIGSTMGLCAVVLGMVHERTGNLTLAIVACLVTGLACGSCNGTLVSRFHVHPLVVTLATFAAFRGAAEGISQGAAYSRFGESFVALSRGVWFSVPIPGYLFALLASATALFLVKTPAGRSLYAIGYNETAARFSGVPVDRLKWWLYAVSGFMAGVTTVLYVSRFDTAKADAGRGFELDVIAAVVLGGTSVFGGRGNIVGTTLGLLVIHETRLFVARYWHIDELRSIVVGFLLIAAVLAYRPFIRSNRD